MTNAVGNAPSNTIGTVSSKDDGFYSGGSKQSFSTLMTHLMLHRVSSVDRVLTGMLNEMNNNNKQTKLMNDYLSGLRELRPTDVNGRFSTVSFDKIKELQTKIEKESENSKDGSKLDLNKEWDLDFNYKAGTPGYKSKFDQSEIDQQIEVMKSKISSVNSNQQMAQIKLEKYNNVRNESMQMASSMMKAANQTLLNVINNFP